MSEATKSIEVDESKEILSQLKNNIGRYIKGKDDVIERTLICLLASGHLLIEDLPGLGKTTLAYCLAKSIDCTFSRIQFTSDLLPTDVTGVSIYDEQTRKFNFKRGPVFANIVLADEINRTTPKTQSSLLEVMDRAKVSVDGVTHVVGNPFMVFATQNPVDYEGTFPLPESQMDRFLMRIQMGYPAPKEELKILKRVYKSYDDMDVEPVTSHEQILKLQKQINHIFVEESVLEFIIRIASATRAETEFRAGISTRGTLALKVAAQARALYDGRNFVIPEDVLEMVEPVLTHRLNLRRQTADALEERRVAAALLHEITGAIPVPL